MSIADKSLLLNEIEGTLKPRMFANLLEEAITEIQDTLTRYDIERIDKTVGENDDYIDAYIAAKTSENKTEKTLIRYRYILVRFMNAVNMTTREVTSQAIRSYFEAEMNRGISANTIRGIRDVLHSYYDWLNQEGMVKGNPVANIAPVKVPIVVRESYKSVDIEKLKRTCDSLRDSAIIAILQSTMCRIEEVCSLNRDDINFQTGEIIVFGKGQKERRVYLNDVALMVLREYLDSRSDNNPALFLNYRSQRLRQGGVRSILHRLADKAGVENVHPHRFRRTAITYLLNRGMPIQDVAILAGHSKLDTTMKYYAASSENIRHEFRKFST